jgi:hypothetical protein
MRHGWEGKPLKQTLNKASVTRDRVRHGEKFGGRQKHAESTVGVAVGEGENCSALSSLESWKPVASLEGSTEKDKQTLVQEGSEKQKGNILCHGRHTGNIKVWGEARLTERRHLSLQLVCKPRTPARDALDV